MKYLVLVRGTEYEVTVAGGGGAAGNRVFVNGEEYRATLRGIGTGGGGALVLDGRSVSLMVERLQRGRWALYESGERTEVEIGEARFMRLAQGSARKGDGNPVLNAPMPGLVVRILVQAGQSVAAGTSLVVLEAMKMENELKAASTGTVEEILVAERQTVERGQPLVRLRPPGDPPSSLT